MASLPFVDTHVHYWNLKDPSLYYSWLQPDWVHPVLGDIDGIKVLRYSADEYIAETRFQNVSKAVHVQAALGIADPVEETRWLQAQADRTGFPHGIVGHVDLIEPSAEETLARHLEHANFRGVRDFAAGTSMQDPAWRRGYGLLADNDLVFCIDTVWEEADAVRGLADEHDQVVLSIDHAGFPRERSDEYFESWKRGMTTLAGAPNIVMKISGLGMCDNEWTVDSIRPWVLSCIEIFGVERSFFGSNWPVDSLYSSYGDVLDAYEAIIADFSPDERTALFSGNAERIFRV
ncbi:MAG TPA: amidohydrolase family protein [Solirubrobacteraceae bacterium]|nr:amidohydrolase family protein [Solirubrobacteraceae bacterium]